MNRSAFSALSSSSASQGALLTPGDRVAFAQDPAVDYEIVHISHQKAWVRSVRSGSQQIVGTGDLRLIMAKPGCGDLVH